MKVNRNIRVMKYDYEYFDTDVEKFVNENQVKSSTDYLITTSLLNKYTYIFIRDYDNKVWKQKSKWLCTIGSPETPTPEGVFDVIGRRPNFGSYDYQVRYATRFKERYYYHSILLDGYGDKVIDDRLGVAISNGCIRLSLENAKWIYDNIPDGTTVIIK